MNTILAFCLPPVAVFVVAYIVMRFFQPAPAALKISAAIALLFAVAAGLWVVVWVVVWVKPGIDSCVHSGCA
jgi:lipopolysaccharide export LptBFGC system permease protein LptF